MTTGERDERAAVLKEIIDGAIERLAEQLAEGHTDEYKRLLSFWSRFHRYSHGNVLLIMSQRPDATQVAGYHTWRRVGRQVKRGAKAISIWCPIVKHLEDPDSGMPVEMCVGFTPCPVFPAEDLVAIATDPLPTLWKALPDDAESQYRFVRQKVEEAGYRVEEADLTPGRQGSSGPDGRIRVARGWIRATG